MIATSNLRIRGLVLCLFAALTSLALTTAAGAREGHGRVSVGGATASRVRFAIATQSPANGSTVSGIVGWQVQTTGSDVSRVDFSVDGKVKSSDSGAPYAFGEGLDTSTLSDGSHTLTATAYGGRRSKLGSSTVVVKVANAAPSPAPTPVPAPEPPAAAEEAAPEPTPPVAPEPTPAPAPEPSPEPSPSQGPKPGSIYWGAWIGDQLTGSQAPWDMNAVTKFEQLAGKKLSIVNFSAPFANCSSSPCSFYNFPTTEFNSIHSHGAIPLFSWGSQSIPLPSNLSEPNFQLADVISGKYDSFIRNFAIAARNWGHPFFLRFNWEMNGTWFAWMEGVNGNQVGESVAAWRHVHDIFTEVGATNATWVWCPNVDPEHNLRSLSSLYPGDQYVDWTGLDGYNAGTNPNRPDRWRTFDQLYSSTYHQIVDTIAPSKPMLIGEVGSSEYGGSKATWIKEMLSEVPTSYPKIRGLVWFDKNEGGMDWPIESSTSATSAFASGIQNPVYASNQFGSLSFSSVLPPG